MRDGEAILILFGVGYLLYKYRKVSEIIQKYTTAKGRREIVTEKYGSLYRAYWELT